MSNPLRAFRKHQKKLIVIFGILLMISFVVLGSAGVVESLTAPNRRDSEDDVVVTWVQGDVTESDLVRLGNGRIHTVNFLNLLEAQARKRDDKVARKVDLLAPAPRFRMAMLNMRSLEDFQMRQQFMQTGQYPIDTTDEGLFSMMMLAQKAEDAGVVIGDEAVLEYFKQVCDGAINSDEYAGILSESSNDRITYQRLMSHMKTELLALNMLVMMNSGGVRQPLPGEFYGAYKKRNWEVIAEVLPILVEEYTSIVAADPTQAELDKIYEEGKKFYPSNESPDPGFARRHQAAFEYLKVDFGALVLRELTKVTPEQIEKYYNENKDEFEVVAIPAGPATDSGGFPHGGSPFESGGGLPPGFDFNNLLPPTGSGSPVPTPPGGTFPPLNDGARLDGTLPADREFYVSLLDDAAEKTEANTEKTQPPGTDPAAVADKTADEDAKDSQPETTNDKTPNDKTPNDKTTDDKTTNDKTTNDKTTNDKTTDDKTTDDKTTDETKADPPEAKPEEKAKPAEKEYKPLKDVEDSIRQKLANEAATARVKKAMDEATAALGRYKTRYDRWKKKGNTEPALPDWQKIARDGGLEFGEAELMNIVDAQHHELGKAVDWNIDREAALQSQSARDFVSLFGGDQYEGKQHNVTMFREMPSYAGVVYLYWKVDDKEAYTPDFDEVRAEVEDAWTWTKAREKAKEAAKDKAAQARKSGKSLEDEFRENVVLTDKFSWWTQNVASDPRQQTIAISQPIDGETVGDDFMKEVFSLGAGKIGVAFDYAKDTVYVIRIAGISSTEEDTRTAFLASGLGDQNLQQLALADAQKFQADWFESLEKEMEVEWQERDTEEDE